MFLLATFIIMCSIVFSLPLHRQLTSDRHLNTFEADNWNRTDESFPNVTSPKKSKWSSKYILDDTGLLNQEPPIKKSKSGAKRGLDIGLKIKFPTTPKYYDKKIDRLEAILEMAKANLVEQARNTSACPKCDGEELPFVPQKRRIKPAYQCDEWDSKYRLCILERNIGDTVTFYLSTGKSNGIKSEVTWKKEFHMRDSKSRTGLTIDPDNSPENIIIGKQGYELRISPITEIDIGYNLFSASVIGHTSAQSTVYFMIRIVPVDLGFVYVGETIQLSLRSYVSFPPESFSFRWYMEKYGEHSTLPSNMKTSASGSSIKISELRQEQEGILACTMYTNLNFLATKKRFLMKDLVKNNDVLKSPPDHNLHFKEENSNRDKRFFKKSERQKREISDEDIEKALMGPTADETSTLEPNLHTTTRSYEHYDIEMDVGNPEPTVKSADIFLKTPYITRGGELPARPMDISIESNPIDVEETDVNGQVAMNQERHNGIQVDTSIQNGLRTDGGKSSFNQHVSEQFSNAESKGASLQNSLVSNPQLPTAKESVFSKNTYENGKKYPDVDTQKGKYGASSEDSEIILNIERIPRKHITAEEKISKIISSCISDYECSGYATCLRNNLKQAGYCKCLLGFYGVGIFCREDIWVNKNDFGMADFRNPEDIPFTSSLPLLE